jgi:hypothetical protein
MPSVFKELQRLAAAEITPEALAQWPCENYNSRHWRTLATAGAFSVIGRVEPDSDCSADYETPPPAGTEWVGIVLQLTGGSCSRPLRTESVWAIETPGFQPLPPSAWQDCYSHMAEVASDLLEELLNAPAVISNLQGEIADRLSLVEALA